MDKLQNLAEQAGLRLADIIIISGHYGCGKTNLALNLAKSFSGGGERVSVVDMDIVNPYFRASDYEQALKAMNAELVASDYARSNVDVPAISAQMYSIFTRKGRIIIDVGGDDVGSTALGRFSRLLKEREYTMLYVINKYRSQSATAGETVGLLREIERSSRLNAHGIVNNSHLMQYTTAKTISDSFEYSDEISRLTDLPVMFTAAERDIYPELKDCGRRIFPVELFVMKPWESKGKQGDQL